MLILIISVIVAIISIIVGRLIKKGQIDSLIKTYINNEDNDFIKIRIIRGYLEESFYTLGCIMGFYGILDYSNYKNSLELLIVALIVWFIITIVGTQLIEK